LKEILFTHSYFLRFDPKEFKAMMPYAPLGTLYAISYVRAKGYSTKLFDSMFAEGESEIRSFIEKFKPGIVVIYDDDFNYLTKMCLSRMRQAAFTMSQIAKQYGCTVIVHGSDAADHVEEYMQHGADYVIIGEGEQTLGELLDYLNHTASITPEHIRGIAYRAEEQVVQTNRRQVMTQLDALPFPAWDHVDVERYRSEWTKVHGYFAMNIVTTRGCPFHCNWCAKPIYGQVYNSRSPENVAEEMLYLKSTYHPDRIWFCDDIFGLKSGWVSSFAEAVKKTNASLPFKCLSRADLLLKENAIPNLADSGCKTVWIGAESGSQKVLDAMEKGTTVEQIHEASRLMREAGINVGFFLQYGYPGETRDDIELTLKMIKECKPDEIGISVSYPLPGTKFYETVKSSLGGKTNWVDSQDLDLMFPGQYVPDFYRALHKVTHKKFRIWQGLDLIKSALTNPRRLNVVSARRISLVAYHAITLPRLQKQMRALAKINPAAYHKTVAA
jgi:anaerobic magnesium-protoporphyrin IX monomethyl ester cyclase